MSGDFEYLDICLRYVPDYGWLYILCREGVEIARGEFRTAAAVALNAGLNMAAKLYRVQQ